ncbi:MAG: hypothetical protein FWG87_10660 [Defluviitaleaceae bacterium]|nr:hypothetical protein [Defluviitaleaceae bacterium]
MCKSNTDSADFRGFMRIRSCKNPTTTARSQNMQTKHGFNGFTQILSSAFFYPHNPCKSVKSE